ADPHGPGVADNRLPGCTRRDVQMAHSWPHCRMAISRPATKTCLILDLAPSVPAAPESVAPPSVSARIAASGARPRSTATRTLATNSFGSLSPTDPNP